MSCAETFHREQDLRVVVARANGNLSAIAPLACEIERVRPAARAARRDRAARTGRLAVLVRRCAGVAHWTRGRAESSAHAAADRGGVTALPHAAGPQQAAGDHVRARNDAVAGGADERRVGRLLPAAVVAHHVESAAPPPPGGARGRTAGRIRALSGPRRGRCGAERVRRDRAIRRGRGARDRRSRSGRTSRGSSAAIAAAPPSAGACA